MRKALSLLIKATVSGLLLYLALNFVNIGTVASRLSRIAPGWVALSLLVLLTQTFLASLRWRQIVTQCGADFPLGQLFRFTMIGLFFNQTLPSSVGGDAMRIWLIGKQANWRVATYSVLLDRGIGVVALAALVAFCLPWTLTLVRDPVGRAALVVIGVGSLGAWLLFIGLSWERLAILQRWTLTRHLANVATVALSIFRSPATLALVFGLSILIQLLTAVMAWCLARSVGADLSLLYALFLVPPVMLVAVVPISIAGWGVREGAMVAAFTYAGLPQSDGLLISLLFGVCTLALGAVGGLVWVFSNARAERHIIPAAPADQA